MVNGQEQDARGRQDQILLMAAEGMTDKEIAAKLGLSPETIGTYWRRILAKHSAASRTEVVAKVLRLQSQVSLGKLQDVNESLREVTDHLLWQISERGGLPQDATIFQQVLEALPDLAMQVDEEGFILYSNADSHGIAVQEGEPLEWVVDRDCVDTLREALSSAFESGSARAEIMLGERTFEGRFRSNGEAGQRTVVMTLREP